MKNASMTLILLLSVTTVVAVEGLKRPGIEEHVSRESVYAKINSVTVLQFNTDRPPSEMRVVLDGKRVDREVIQTISTNLLLAIVPMPQRMEVHVRAGDKNALLLVPLPEDVHDDVGDREYFGPGRNIALTNWTRVYCITRITIAGKVLNTLDIEVK